MPECRKDVVPGSDRGLFKIFQRGKGEPEPDIESPDTFLLVQDEFKSTLNKLNIQGSSLAPTLCTLWYKNSAGSSDKTGSHEMIAKLNILGGLPVEDEASFGEYFGSETTNGLYTRFVYGVGPSQWNWTFTGWKAKPEVNRVPSKVHVPAFVEKVRQDWIAEGRLAGKKSRGRLGEIALRVAVISASANHDTTLSMDCLKAAFAFAEWQESIIEKYTAGVSETTEGKVTSAVMDTLEGLRVNGVSHWVKFWPLARNKNWSRKYGATSVGRIRESLVSNGTLVEELYDEDDEGHKKSNRTGYVRLRNEPGVVVDPSPTFEQSRPAKKPKRTREEFRAIRDRSAGGEKSITGRAEALEGEVSDDL
jgi:hypothetical protein